MSEARKLDPSFDLAAATTQTGLPHLTALPQPLPPPRDDAHDDLSQKPAAPANQITAAIGPTKFDRAARVALIFFLIGLVAFVASVALSSAILLGILDLQTGWVKDTLSAVKVLIKQLTSR